MAPRYPGANLSDGLRDSTSASQRVRDFSVAFLNCARVTNLMTSERERQRESGAEIRTFTIAGFREDNAKLSFGVPAYMRAPFLVILTF